MKLQDPDSLLGEALGGRYAHLDSPQVVGDEMEEITKAEGEAGRVIWGNLRQITAVEIQVGEILMHALAALEVRHLGRRVELLPRLIREAGIGRDVADGKLTGVEAGDVFE